VEQAPSEPYAAFNLALALDRMSLVHQSYLAWRRYLILEDENAWRQEASERLARLRVAPAREHWEAERKAAMAAAAGGDHATLMRLAREFPRQMKELLEGELLVAWGEAAGTPSEGVRLAAAKGVARVLRETGERLYADAIGAIESRLGASQALVDGHLAYGQGLSLRRDCAKAKPAFEFALKRLSAGGSPMAWAARYQQLVCIYRSRALDAEEPLAKLAAEIEGLPYPTLRAKTEVMRGLCAMADGRHSQAVTHYERALDLLRGVGETDLARFNGVLDEAYRFLGDRETSWRYRQEALRGARVSGDRQVLHAVLAGLARDLVGEDRREVARAVLDEMLANALAWSEPGPVAEVLLRRIQLDLLSGSDDLAVADIAACRRQLARDRQPGDRERLETELMVASAEQQLTSRPSAAAKVLVDAVSRLERSADGLILPRALLALARARVSVGDIAAAEESFDRGLQIYEARREGTAGEALRIGLFSTAQASFDAMIHFQALGRGDARAAFSCSERVRARALRDRLHARTEVAMPFSLDEELDCIPLGVAVFAYTVLPEKLLLWHLQHGSLTMHVLPLTRREVAETVTSLRAAMTGPSPRKAGELAGARAFDVLLRPAFKDLAVEMKLVFVPDRELYQLPFSAMFDQSRGRFMIEDHSCLVVPSLELYLSLLEHRSSAAYTTRRLLAVGDPAFDRGRFPALRNLPHAREEALAVAALYPDALSLVGESATRQRILDELPGRQVIHLAAHVVINARDPLGSLVATADLGRAPLRATDLSADRLAGVVLVVLAGCDTAPGFADGNREGVAGLARAFLGAGVPSVLATLWAVDDQAASRLAVTFHSRLLEGEAPAEALRFAQVALLSERSSSAPFAWAPFVLFSGF
jgi:CHAT domain-containing protein